MNGCGLIGHLWKTHCSQLRVHFLQLWWPLGSPTTTSDSSVAFTLPLPAPCHSWCPRAAQSLKNVVVQYVFLDSIEILFSTQGFYVSLMVKLKLLLSPPVVQLLPLIKRTLKTIIKRIIVYAHWNNFNLKVFNISMTQVFTILIHSLSQSPASYRQLAWVHEVLGSGASSSLQAWCLLHCEYKTRLMLHTWLRDSLPFPYAASIFNNAPSQR